MVAEAQKIPLSSSGYHFVYAHSVFHYFPDLAYAEKALREMVRVRMPGGKVAVLDVNDAAKESLYIAQRRATIAHFEEKYRLHPHLFYPKAWFVNLAEQLGIKVEIVDWHNLEYANSSFRYHVFFDV